MTGRYQHRAGGLECAIGPGNVGRYDDVRLRGKNDLGLPAEGVSLARLLKDAGYLARDPGEGHDLSARRAGDVARLRRLLAAWEAEVKPRR